MVWYRVVMGCGLVVETSFVSWTCKNWIHRISLLAFFGLAGRGEIRVPTIVQADDEKLQKKIAKKLAKENVPQRTSVQKKVDLFSHLHQYERQQSLTREIKYVVVSNKSKDFILS